MYNLKKEIYFKIIFIISILSLTSAYFIEYILGYQPCNLCLIERIPYGLGILLVILYYILKKSEQFIGLLLIIIFAFSLIISLYHFGIEQSFFKESPVCKIINNSDILSKEELLKQLQVKTVSCKDVTFRVFGFSLTTLNIIISIIMLILSVKIFRKNEKFQK